jgi:hypothetical protein
MADKEQYKPFEPEKTVDVTITRREAILLQKLRKYAFGKIMVHKVNGVVVRIEPQLSELIELETEIDLS